MNWIKKLLTSQKGTVTILTAAALVALTGFAALVTDAGLLYINRMKLVDALDSAVLAGVQVLAEDSGNPLEIAMEYAKRNGLAEDEVEFTISEDNTTISGRATRNVELFFARILGFDNSDVAGSAKARISPVTTVTGIAPFGVIEDEYVFGQEVVLKEGAGDGPYHGWFGALRLGGNGANVYRNNVKYGYQGKISIGDVILTEPGNMSGPTKQGIDYRINQCHHVPQCSIYSFVQGCPRILIIPIVNIESQNPAGHVFSVRVVGFAAFLVDQYVGQGTENAVRGCFIRYVIPGETGEQTSDFGLYSSQLIE